MWGLGCGPPSPAKPPPRCGLRVYARGAESGRAFAVCCSWALLLGSVLGRGRRGPCAQGPALRPRDALVPLGRTWSGPLRPHAGLAQSPSGTRPKPLTRLAPQVWPALKQAGSTAPRPRDDGIPSSSPRDFIHPSGLYVPAVPAPHLPLPVALPACSLSVPHSALPDSRQGTHDPCRARFTQLPQEKVRCAGISPSSVLAGF